MRLLVIGPPRSGTTWIAEAMAAATSATYVHEPDNPDLSADAARNVTSHGLNPMLDDDAVSPGYAAIWDRALRLGNPATRLARAARLLPARDVVIKSVFCIFAAGWVANKCDARVILVRRNPLNIVASWENRGWFVPADLYGCNREFVEHLVRSSGLPEPPSVQGLRLTTWWVATQLHWQRKLLAEHDDWLLVDHDDTCIDPATAFETALARLGISPAPQLYSFLETSDQADTEAGRGKTGRQPDNWRGRLSGAQVAEIRKVLDSFPPEATHPSPASVSAL